MRKICIAAIAAVLVVLSGCETVNGLAENRATHVVVRAGVAEFIGGEAATAKEVIAWTEEVLALIEGNPDILLSELRDQALKWIPWDDLSPGRLVLATEVLAFVEAHVKSRIEAGELPADATVGLRQLLETARWQAELSMAIAEH